MSGVKIRAVLFDMDGTLIDTAPDIAVALNSALRANGVRELDQATITDMVGKGARVLVERALDHIAVPHDAALVDSVLQRYLNEFSRRRGNDGKAFAGAGDCLRELCARGLKLGVVTNALQRSAEATLTFFGLDCYLDTVLGGDETPQPKPHPAPLWTACHRLGVSAAETLMVGDSANDVTAARAAGCHLVCVPHGYNEGRPVAELGCPVIARLTDLPAWIDSMPRRERSSSAA